MTFKYLISGASEVHPRYADFIFNSFRSPENGLSRYFEMRNLLNVPFFPGCRFFPIRLNSLVFKCHACADPEGGGGVRTPIPGKSQVLSNSIEISIPPPPVNSWTPRIPGKFWTKKPQNKHKKSRLFSRVGGGSKPNVGLGPPPPSLTKKSGSAHALTFQPLTPGLTQCQKELYGYFCTLAELSTNHRGPHRGGGRRGAEINLLVPQKSTICFPGFHVPQHFLCLLVPLKSCTYLLCSLPKTHGRPHQLLTYTPPSILLLLLCLLLNILYFCMDNHGWA